MKKIYFLIILLLSNMLAFAQTLPPPPDGYKWSANLLANGTLTSTDLSSFYFVGGVGSDMKIVRQDGSNAIEVLSSGYNGNNWDNQFFIRMGDTFYDGDEFYLSFSCKAENATTCSTEAHSKPGSYNHWSIIGNIDFTSNWRTYEFRKTVNAEMAGNNGLQSIAFDLNAVWHDTNRYYFRNLSLYKLQHKPADYSKLCINEIQVANNDLFIDPSFNYGGWMELYNAGTTPVNMGGMYVSDDPQNLKKFRLPPSTAGSVPAHGYANIWFDHNEADGSFSDMAANQVRFKLDMEGGTIYLSDFNGDLIQSVTYPPATPRCSWARLSDGASDWGTTGTPTPGRSNAGSKFATIRLEAPVVNNEGGLFEMGETVNFKVDIPAGATLRYTKDGSTPTASHGSRSTTGNFSVNSTTVYRFCLVQDDKLPSPVVTRSFIFRNRNYYLPVLSIATQSENLFGNEIGLYVRGTNGVSGRGQDGPCNWNRDWERPVNVEYFVPQQNSEGDVSFLSVINQEADFEIFGGWSRGFEYPGIDTDGRYYEAKSSFKLKTSKTYDGENELPYPVFPNKPYNKYKVWQVRNGGNDTGNRAKDALLQQLVIASGFDVDCQDYQPCHVFFNGQYLGMLNIREASNKQFGYSNFGIDTDDIDQFENWGDWKAGDNAAWNELQSRADRLAHSRSASDYEAVKELLDVDEFINYMAVQCYLGGDDWLRDYVNNLKAYRSRSDGGRFRFVLYDLDGAFSSDFLSMFSNIVDGGIHGGIVGDLFRSLMQYERFRSQFLDAMCLVEGSVLLPSSAKDMAQRICDDTREAMSFEGLSPRDMVSEALEFRYKGVTMDNVAAHSCYGLDNPYWLNLSSNIQSAQLLLNGQRIPTDRFNGRVYNYNNNGVHLQAQAPAGYRFIGWMSQGSIVSTLIDNASEWDYYDQGSMDNYDWKNPDFNASSHGWKMSRPAPFGYGNSGSPAQQNSNTTLDYGGDAGNKRPTYYLRKTFYVDHQPSADDTYRLSFQVDDGFAAYLNGKYIYGFRVSESDARYNYVTGANDYAGWEPDLGTFVIDASDIRQGWNTLAVEIHNNSYSSSDMFWDCKLVGTRLEESSFITSSPTLCLSDKSVGAYSLTAMYERIENENQRYEAGGVPVRINEVSAGNDIYINEYHKKKDWLELYNTTDEDIDLSGLYLSDNASKPQKWQISTSSANTIIPAHGTRIIWCDEMESLSQLHAPFKLSNADGACVSIQSADGTWADQMTYLQQPRWQTFGRYPDGGNYTSLLSLPTIDRSNYLATIDYNVYDPYEDSESAITLALAEGWNWTSHNLVTDVNISRFSYYAREFRSQTQQCVYDEALGWQGGLNTLNSTQGYKLQMKQATDITLRGYLYDAAVPVPLQKGWNWVGVPLQNATVLAAALKNYEPTEGDQIVGLDEFAIYENGMWNGSLTTLEPGQAYLFNVGQSQSLKWNDLNQSGRAKQRRYEAAQRQDMAPWNLNIHAYPDVMTVVAQLDADELVLLGNYYVGVFCGDECRGVAKVDDNLLYVNVHGEGGETLQFRLIDAEGNQYTSKQDVGMKSMLCLGSPSSPYLLHFGADEVEDVIGDMMPSRSQVVSVQYYNLNGQRVSRPQGIYLERILLKDGTVQVRKVR